MATPRAAPGGKENRWDGVPGSARRRPTTPRDLYDYNGRRIDPSARAAAATTTTREAFTPRSNRRELDDGDSRGRAGGHATERTRPSTAASARRRPSTARAASNKPEYDSDGRRITRDGRLRRDVEEPAASRGGGATPIHGRADSKYPSRGQSTLGGPRRRPGGAGTGAPGRRRACWTDPRSIPGRAGSASTTGTRRKIEPKR